MAFTWIVSRIIRLFGQKTNALFYLLTYRELQAEIVELAGKLGVSPADLSKEIGRRAARESAQRHASVLGIVPINPNSPEQIKKYIEVLWFVLFGKEMRDYTVRVDDETQGHQRLTFLLEHCPVCMGHEEDAEAYQDLYKTFTGNNVEGYACLMAGMLEDLARIIMENKNMDIRIIIRETQCYARGDDVMAVESQVMPVQEYEELKQHGRVETGLSTAVSAEQAGEFGATTGGGLEGIGQQSARLFSKVYESLQLEKLDSFFEAPSDKIKERLSESIEQQLHFKPNEILEYFQNYGPDIFRVLGYLAVHALNEAGGIVEKLVGSYLMNKLIDVVISAVEYGLETYIPERLIQDNKRMVMEFVQGWAPESSVQKINEMDSKIIFKLVLEGVKLALADFGAEFVGAKDATWTLLKKTSILQNEGETPSESFNLVFDIFQEATLVAGYLMALPIKALVSTEYEAARAPIDSVQDIYHASRDHLEKLFDLIERFQEMDRSNLQERRIGDNVRKAFPRVF